LSKSVESGISCDFLPHQVAFRFGVLKVLDAG